MPAMMAALFLIVPALVVGGVVLHAPVMIIPVAVFAYGIYLWTVDHLGAGWLAVIVGFFGLLALLPHAFPD